MCFKPTYNTLLYFGSRYQNRKIHIPTVSNCAIPAQDMHASLAEQRVDPLSLTGRHKTRKSKEDRLVSVHEGREGREFGAAAARRNNKAGGRSNKEKMKSKNLPLGARKAVARRRIGNPRAGASRGRSKRYG